MSTKVKVELTPQGGIDLVEAHLKHEPEGFWFNVNQAGRVGTGKAAELELSIGGAEQGTFIVLNADGTWRMTTEVYVSVN
jgi:hypothetical protein